jgi:hypothetical protein
MNKCPYTWFRSFFKSARTEAKDPTKPAENLHVKVIKNGVEVVSVALPAHSARWLMELIPGDVLAKIKAEDIPIDSMMQELSSKEALLPQEIFHLKEEFRTVEVWLE